MVCGHGGGYCSGVLSFCLDGCGCCCGLWCERCAETYGVEEGGTFEGLTALRVVSCCSIFTRSEVRVFCIVLYSYGRRDGLRGYDGNALSAGARNGSTHGGFGVWCLFVSSSKISQCSFFFTATPFVLLCRQILPSMSWKGQWFHPSDSVTPKPLYTVCNTFEEGKRSSRVRLAKSAPHLQHETSSYDRLSSGKKCQLSKSPWPA